MGGQEPGTRPGGGGISPLSDPPPPPDPEPGIGRAERGNGRSRRSDPLRRPAEGGGGLAGARARHRWPSAPPPAPPGLFSPRPPSTRQGVGVARPGPRAAAGGAGGARERARGGRGARGGDEGEQPAWHGRPVEAGPPSRPAGCPLAPSPPADPSAVGDAPGRARAGGARGRAPGGGRGAAGGAACGRTFWTWRLARAGARRAIVLVWGVEVEVVECFGSCGRNPEAKGADQREIKMRSRSR